MPSRLRHVQGAAGQEHESSLMPVDEMEEEAGEYRDADHRDCSFADGGPERGRPRKKEEATGVCIIDETRK